jgi:predicted PurR-regulated permease PerM
LLVALALAIFSKFAAAFVAAVTLAVVCRPLYDAILALLIRPGRLALHLSLARDLASVATQFLVGLFLLVCVLAPTWVLYQNRKVIVASAEAATDRAREWSRGEIQSLGERLQIKEWNDFDELPDPAEDPAPAAALSPQDQPMQNKLVDMVSHPAPFIPLALRTFGGGAVLLGQVMLFFMTLHFLFLHGPNLWRLMLAKSPAGWSPTFAALSGRGRTVLMSTCLVHGLTAASAFVLALPVFFVIVGLKKFVVFAMLAGFFQLLPLVGSVTLVSLMTLYFFATGGAVAGWECLVLGLPLIVCVPDLVIRPYLSERYGKVHSLTMLVGFITGIEVFGPLGFVLGPLFLDLIVQFTKQVLDPPEDAASEVFADEK